MTRIEYSRVRKGGVVTIPKSIREKIDIKEDDMVIFCIEDNNIVIKKAILKPE